MSRRWLLLTVIALAIGLFIAFGPDDQTVIREAAGWRDYARTNLFAALVVFFIVEVAAVALSLPVGFWMSALAGFLFGLWVGVAVVSIAAMFGAFLAFLSARYIFADAIRRLARTRPRLNRWLAAIDAGFRAHGAYYVLLLRLTPVIPFWTLNLGLGLTRVRLFAYWWATQLGMLPATLVVVNAGASLAEIASVRDVLSWRVLGALGLLPLVPFVLHHTAGRLLETPPLTPPSVGLAAPAAQSGLGEGDKTPPSL